MAYLIILLPLLGSLLGYYIKPLGDRFSEIIPTLLVIASAVLSAIVFYRGIIFDEYSNYIIFFI